MAYLCFGLMLVLLIRGVDAQAHCSATTDLGFLNEIIISQLNTSCTIEVKLIEKSDLSDYCYQRAVTIVVSTLFDLLKFKDGSKFFNKIKGLQTMYDRLSDCKKTEDEHWRHISACLQTTYLSPVQILETFKDYFNIYQHFNPNTDDDEQCMDIYEACPVGKASTTKGPSPTTLKLSSPYSQKFKNHFNSNSNASTTPFTENMSEIYSQSPQQSSEGITKIPAEVQPLTTIVDHVASTEHLDLTPETPITDTEMATRDKKGRTEPTDIMSLSPPRASYPYIKDRPFPQIHGKLTSTTITVGRVDVSTDYDVVSKGITNIPYEVQPLTTIMDHVASTEHLDLTPETPIIDKEMATRGEKGRTESTDIMSLSPPKAYNPFIKATPFSQIHGKLTSATITVGRVDVSTDYDVVSKSITNIPAEVQPLTTIMDLVDATEHLNLTPETPVISTEMEISGEEGSTESAYSLSSTRANYPYFNTESTDGLQREKITITTKGSKVITQINGEITSVRKKIVGVDESTDYDIVLKNSVPVIQTYSSEHNMKHGIDTSTSTATKMRRSVESVDGTTRAYSATHAQHFLSTDASASNLPHSSFLHASMASNSLQTIPQEKPNNNMGNLGWASSYPNSAMLTTESVSPKLTVSSHGSGVQSPIPETSPAPAHKGGYTYNTHQQQEQLGFIFEDREEGVAGPSHGSNPLPIIETERRNDGRQKEHRQVSVYLVMVPSILALVLLCGLLYTLYRYRLLKRTLNRDRVLWLPEQQPLQIEENV